jgi:hypothetical protein
MATTKSFIVQATLALIEAIPENLLWCLTIVLQHTLVEHLSGAPL